MTGSQAPTAHRPPLSGSAFIRLLAALDDAPTATAQDAFAAALSRWVDWTDAISLSAALDSPPEAGIGASAAALRADEREVARVRAALRKTIAQDGNGRTSRPELRTAPPPEPADDDFEPWRERYLGAQRAMDANIGPLRRRVRSTLAGASPEMARLAAVDGVMEQVVGGRERALLAGVATRLAQRFETLRARHEATPDDPDTPRPPVRWPDTFGQEMRDVLAAELDFRMQPVEGLLEALRRSADQ